jgi:hypothetical protein
MSSPLPVGVRLPIDLMSEAALGVQAQSGGRTLLLVSDDYEDLLAAAKGQSEVLGIQRLLTLARSGAALRVNWQPAIAKKAFASGPIYPMLAVLLLIQSAEHWLVEEDGKTSKLAVESVRRSIVKHRLAKDFFADSDIVVCADNLGKGCHRTSTTDPRASSGVGKTLRPWFSMLCRRSSAAQSEAQLPIQA